MENAKHEWCRDVSRDEAVRAAEDAANWRLLEMGEVVEEGDEYESRAFKRWERVPKLCVGKPIDRYHLPHRRRRVPAIQHRDLPEQVALLWASVTDILGRVVRIEGEIDAGQTEEAAPACDQASPVEGLRTERVVLEFHIEGPPPTQWPWSYILNRSDAFKMRPGESVRVVEETRGGRLPDMVAWITAERDAAQAERDAARAEAERLKAQVYELQTKEIGILKKLVEERDAVSLSLEVALDRVHELEATAKADFTEHERLRARVAELEQQIKLDDRWAAAAPAANAGGEKQEPMAWAVLGRGIIRAISVIRSDAEDAQSQFACDTTLVPLYAAPPEPRGWLTAEEREAVAELLPYTYSEMQFDRLKNLLARESPPRVRRPQRSVAFPHQRDAEWIAAIREAGGEVAE